MRCCFIEGVFNIGKDRKKKSRSDVGKCSCWWNSGMDSECWFKHF